MSEYKNLQTYLAELGEKIKMYRVSMGLTQKDLEVRSGVSQRSISRLEQGESVQLDNFIRIMLALNLGDHVDILIPDQTKRPSYYLKSKAKGRQRVRKSGAGKTEFKWGDEE